MNADELNQVSHIVIGSAIEVHRILGPGLLESTYEECLAWELQQQGLSVQKQIGIPVQYKELHINVMRNSIKRIVNNF